MTRTWTEAAIAAELEGCFYGIDGKCRNEEREKIQRETKTRADAIRAMRQEQAKKVIVRNGAFTPAAILAAVAHAHNLGVADIVSRARFKHISHARQHACALMRELTGLSFNDIAQAVGISDHGTAHHACKIWAERGRVYADEDRAARQMLGANQ